MLLPVALRTENNQRPRVRGGCARSPSLLCGGLILAGLAALSGCGSGIAGVPSSVATVGTVAGMSGHVHGGQQPVSGSQVYLYAVSTTATGGAATSLLNAPGYVTTDANGNFNITQQYTCPAGAYVYLLALGGNPGLSGTVNNPDLALATGLGACSSLTASSFFTVNEVTTVATAYALSSYATSETNIGSATASNIDAAFGEISGVVDTTHGMALATTSTAGSSLQANINSLANTLAACVNSNGSNSICAGLMGDAGVTAGQPVDTFQAVLNIANNPTVNVQAIYNIGASNGPFQPTLTMAPASWMLPESTYSTPANYTLPAFFSGQVVQPNTNGTYYLAFPNGNYFGYYTFLNDPHYIDHFDMGDEYVTDNNDAQGGVYFYDFASGHYWYTSQTYPFPYMYDSTLNSVIYYYPDPNNAGHYNTNGVRYFYVFSTGQIITM